MLNVDARYVRFIPLTARLRVELFVEAKNLFNTADRYVRYALR